MKIIMTYHSLVGRDARYVSRRWQVVIIVILLGIVACNLLASFKMHFLQLNFHEYCFIKSHIVFRPIDNGLIIKELQNVSLMKEVLHTRVIQFSEKDKEFFDRAKIDKRESDWGKQRNCDFAAITPLVFAFCAVVWIAMFITCGHGGVSRQMIMPKPWQMVVPSTIFFVCAAIGTAVLVIFLKITLDEFCHELNKSLEGEYYCGFLLDQFSLVNKESKHFSHNCYFVILVTLAVSNGLWILAALVMVIRILFVVDFQLIRVIISRIEPIEGDRSAAPAGRTRQITEKSHHHQRKHD